jgi:hypothetical protein
VNSVIVTENSRTVAALEKFVKDLILDDRFDYIVPVERKGTALVRAALGSTSRKQWKHILSSDAIETVTNPERARNVLILDDSVWTGQSLIQAVASVRKILPNAEITTAAFVTHRQAPSDLVDIAYYQNVDDQCYHECRSALVDYLQVQGSLLLDTEHVEVTTRITVSPSALYEALAGWGDTVVFASGERVNCTVMRRADSLMSVFNPISPKFADLTSAICKVRVVSSPKERGVYSIIPICYPQLRLGDLANFQNPHMPWTSAISWNRADPSSRLFQCVGLSLSIELALEVMMHLADALPEQVSFEYGADGIDHLLATFPELDPVQIRTRLDHIADKRRSRRAKAKPPDDPGTDILEGIASEILLLCYDRWSYETGFVRKVTIGKIMELARYLGQPEARLSAALDILIDSARILPDVGYETIGDEVLVRRVFGPEGEIVKRKLIRRALGLGKGFERVAG